MREAVFALATAPGRSAVAVVRLSGPDLRPYLVALFSKAPQPRRAALRRVRGSDGAILDQALALWFPGPDSFTGEDVLELHLHGGPAIVEGVSEALAALGAKPAAPGEFTRRAFEAGRMDLTQAEAVADLVDAETTAQREQALSQLSGALRDRYARWRDLLIDAAAFLEAQIDFPDEEIPPDVMVRARAPLEGLRQEIDAAAADTRGERVRDGLRIALTGAPNAGKSTLFNRLVGREAAIVTAIPGTTRDVLEAALVIEGFKVVVADTAGLRQTADVIEAEGVRRARLWAREADLCIRLIDPSDAALAMEPEGDLVLFTKSDLGVSPPQALIDDLSAAGIPWFSISALEEPAALRAWLRDWLRRRMSGREAPAITQLRHREELATARSHLVRAIDNLGADAELAAEDVRLVVRALERLSGRVSVDDVLDRVFGRFCIGK